MTCEFIVLLERSQHVVKRSEMQFGVTTHAFLFIFIIVSKII